MTETPLVADDKLTEFRRQLVKTSQMWHDRFQKSLGEDDDFSKANPGELMAGSYAYTLAAVLKVAEIELGPEAARQLGRIAEEILENGDFDDWNADVSGLAGDQA